MHRTTTLVTALILCVASHARAETMAEWNAHQREKTLEHMADEARRPNAPSGPSALDTSIAKYHQAMAEAEKNTEREVVATYTVTTTRPPTQQEVEARVTKLAEGGDMTAVTLLAHWRLSKPSPSAEDYAVAKRWLERGTAADYGDAYAMLAMMYYDGRGVSQDLVKARELAGMAVAKGNDKIEPMYGLLLGMELPGAPSDPARATPYLMKAADQGDTRAMTMLGMFLVGGQGMKKDPARAVPLLERAAVDGVPLAQFHLGMLLVDGEGIAADAAAGFKMLTLAYAALTPGEPAHNQCGWYLGILNSDGLGTPRDPVKAAVFFRDGADHGWHSSEFNLGCMLLDGADGVPAKPAEGVALVRKVSDAGDSRAMTMIARMMITGSYGVTVDRDAGHRLLVRSADKGHAQAQGMVGFECENGQDGVTKDEIQALRYYQLAAAQGDAYALWRVAIFQYVGKGGMTEDHTASIPWFAKAAAAGMPPAQKDYGELLLLGDGVSKDEAKGVEMLELGLKDGNGDDAFNVADCYERAGRIPDAVRAYRVAVERGNEAAKPKLAALQLDGPAAIAALRASADKGDLDALFQLGGLSLSGEHGVAVDAAAGRAMIQRSAEGGNAKAQERMGDACEHGTDGCPQDDAKALTWYRKAADQGRPQAMWREGLFIHAGRGGVPADVRLGADLIRRAAEGGVAMAQKDFGEMLIAGDGVAEDAAAGVAMLEKALHAGDGMVALRVGEAYLRVGRADAGIIALRIAAKADIAEAKQLLADLDAH